MAKRELVGGPGDGLEVRSSDVFLVVTVEGRVEAADGRPGSLYRRELDRFVYVGARVRQCEGCHGFVDGEKAACPLCGGACASRA